MSLDKAIEYGKDKRRAYRRSKAFDRSCRNHGSCDYCKSNRQHKFILAEQRADEQIKEYLEIEDEEDIEWLNEPIEQSLKLQDDRAD